MFIAILLSMVLFMNYLSGVRFFGEFEFWLPSIKIAIVVGIIIFSLVIALGGGPYVFNVQLTSLKS